jgi:hypothetical protein
LVLLAKQQQQKIVNCLGVEIFNGYVPKRLIYTIERDTVFPPSFFKIKFQVLDFVL